MRDYYFNDVDKKMLDLALKPKEPAKDKLDLTLEGSNHSQ